jgi:hypothetical protein
MLRGSAAGERTGENGGKEMYASVIYWFFRRKAKIVFFTMMTYAALC